MIVGADAADDATILATSAQLYGAYRLQARLLLGLQPDPRRRPRAAAAGAAAGARAPALPGRLADALLRLRAPTRSRRARRRHAARSTSIPSWPGRCAHRERFPVDLNRAPRELLLRVPGLGVQAVDRLLLARRVRRVRAEDLQAPARAGAKVLPFVVVDGPSARRVRSTRRACGAAASRGGAGSLFDAAAAAAWTAMAATMRVVRLADETDLDGFRRDARALLAEAVPPEQ